MCLGAEARAANSAAMRDYERKLQKREADWMQQLSLTKAEHVQYDQSITASNLGLAATYGEIEDKRKQLIGQMFQENEAEWQQFLQKNTGGELEAAGRTGRSIGRISTLDLAEYLRKGSRRAYQLTQATDALQGEAAKAAGQARAQQLQAFTNVMFMKQPDLPPPQPVMQNVGMAMFKDALSIGSSIATMATGVPDIKNLLGMG